jgi:hypothetical protein
MAAHHSERRELRIAVSVSSSRHKEPKQMQITIDELCKMLGCSISQFGWAEWKHYFNRADSDSICNWADRVKQANDGSFPSRINYRRVPIPIDCA